MKTRGPSVDPGRVSRTQGVGEERMLGSVFVWAGGALQRGKNGSNVISTGLTSMSQCNGPSIEPTKKPLK